MKKDKNIKRNNIKVYARVRPSKISIQHHYDVQKQSSNSDLLVLHGVPENKDGNKYGFLFQKVFKENTKQCDLYEIVAKPIIEGVFNGYNGAILAYGQTGTGKTHSITGGNDGSSRGMIPRAFNQMFNHIKQVPEENFSVSISIMEIYNELCYDLLSEEGTNHEGFSKVVLLEDSAGTVKLRNLSEHKVDTMSEVEKLLFKGMTNRTVADTPMNPVSSRSHCIFTLNLSQKAHTDKKRLHSKLHMIDLSGSERVWKNNTSGLLLHEAKHINLSLHYLEQVIIALAERRRAHVPYRNSTITSLLRDSLGGNSSTAMVFTLSLEPQNFQETLSTCRFSQRVSMVKTTSEKIFVDNGETEEELKFLRGEVDRLKRIIGDMNVDSKNDKVRTDVFEEYEENDHDQLFEKTETHTKNDKTFNESSNLKKISSSKKNVRFVNKLTGSQGTIQQYNLGVSFDFKSTVMHINRGIMMLTTLLRHVSTVLTMQEDEKIKIFEVDELTSIMGLTLPRINPVTAEEYSEEKQKGFKKFLKLRKSNKALYLYADMHISYFTQLETEWHLWKKISTLMPEIETLESELSKAESKGEFPDVIESLENEYMSKKRKIERAKEKLEFLSNERFNCLKIFSKAKQSLLKSFEIWWNNVGSDLSKTESKTRLKQWSKSLKSKSENNIEKSKLQNYDVKSHSEDSTLIENLNEPGPSLSESSLKCFYEKEKPVSLTSFLQTNQNNGSHRSKSFHNISPCLSIKKDKNISSISLNQFDEKITQDKLKQVNFDDSQSSINDGSNGPEEQSALWQCEVRDLMKNNYEERPCHQYQPVSYGSPRKVTRKSNTMIHEMSKQRVLSQNQNSRNIDIKLTGDSAIDREIMDFYNNRAGT